MKKSAKIMAFCLSGFFLSFQFVFAASSNKFNYTPLEPIPGFPDATDFPTYLSAIYKFGIWTVGIAALLMITIGGFMYMTSAGNQAKMTSAKEVIKDALLGLIVAMFSWLLLYVINPDLVKGTLNFNHINDRTYSTAGQTTGGAVSQTIKEAATKIQNNSNIVLQGSAQADCDDASGNGVSPQRNIQELAQGNGETACFDGCKSGSACTAVIVPDKKLLDTALCVAESNKYEITSIAGGDHSANSGHYAGKALDAVPKDSASFSDLKRKFDMCAGATVAHCDKSGSFVDCATGNPNHIHVGV